MKALPHIIPLLILLPLWNLSGEQGKPSGTLKIDPSLLTDFYNDCMKRETDFNMRHDIADPASRAAALCKEESSDPDFVKNYGKEDETGKFVPITGEDRQDDYAHCISRPWGDDTDPKTIAYCRDEAANNRFVHDFLSNPIRKVRKVYVAKFRGDKKIKGALRDTCIEVADSTEGSDASLIQLVHSAEYQPGQDYDVTCASDSISARCTDGVTTDTTNCGPDGNCVSTTRHNKFKELALVDSRSGKELDWIEPGVWPKPGEIAESLSKAVGCTKGKKPPE